MGLYDGIDFTFLPRGLDRDRLTQASARIRARRRARFLFYDGYCQVSRRHMLLAMGRGEPSISVNRMVFEEFRKLGGRSCPYE